MKKVKTVKDLKWACDIVKTTQEKDYIQVEMNKDILKFLISIYGKNRPEVPSNISSIYKSIKDGEWNEDLGTFTINASATWLCSGHHRLLALIASEETSRVADFQILPDDRANKKFLSDDTMIATRSSAQQASLFLNIKNAKDIRSVMTKIEYFNGNPNQKISVDAIQKFSRIWETTLDEHGFYYKRIGSKYIPRFFYAIAIHLKIKGKEEMSSTALDMIDKIYNPNTESESARLIREQILSHGSSDESPAVHTFMKSIVKGELVRTKAFAKEKEMPLIREALGIVNTTVKNENAIIGSRNYFKKIIREMKK